MSDQNKIQDETQKETTHADSVAINEPAVEIFEENPLQKDLDKAKSDLLYLGAEFENYKRNAIKDRSELLKFGAERLAKDLLEVVDNFERALAVENPSIDVIKQGISLIHKEMMNLLLKHNIREVESQGVPFDPSTHEALTSEETDSVPEGHVSRVFKRAYKIHDRLIRPAQVVVAKAPSKKVEG